MNPATYQNMNSDNVDWAALAQQWIKMKEAAPASSSSPNLQDASQTIITRNEVPMDMDGSDDGVPPAPPAPTISGSENWNQWNQWENQWNQPAIGSNLSNWEWNNGRSAQKALKTPNIPNTAVIAPPAPMISTCPPFTNQCVVPPTIPQVPPPHSYTYNALPASHSQFSNQIISNEFWTNEPHSETNASLAKNMHDLTRMPFGPMGIDIPRKRDIRDTTPEDDLSITLDTVKRRQLPAWIREGLEKMEREKQKAIEREQLEALRLKELENKKISEEEARAVLDPAKSKFDTDSDQEVTEFEMEDEKKTDNLSEDQVSEKDKYEKRSPDYVQPRKTRFKDASSPITQSNDTIAIINEKVPDTIPQQAVIYQSKDEMLQIMMLKVRRSLTEILLEVTNDEIGSVCKDVWKRFCSKEKTTTNAGPAVLSQLSRKLGLGIYSDSNSESDEDRATNSEHLPPPQDDEVESDEEIMKNLRQRQVAFRMTEAEIEARLAEEEKNDDENDEKSDDSEKNQHVKRNNSNLPDESNSLTTSNERPKISRERILSESSNPKREPKISDSYDSPSLQSTSHHSSTKKNSKHNNNKNSNNKITRASSSRSRSQSKSSRDCSPEHRINEYQEKKGKKKDISKYAAHKTRSRSSSRSRRKNHSRTRSCSKSSSRSKHKYKKSRSRSTSKRRKRSRSRHKSRSRRKKSVSPSHSSSRSRSRSSTSHKESRSSYSRNSYERDTGSKRRRESRSRSNERKRRSVSSSRSSKKRRDKSYHREKKSKKSHRY